VDFDSFTSKSPPVLMRSTGNVAYLERLCSQALCEYHHAVNERFGQNAHIATVETERKNHLMLWHQCSYFMRFWKKVYQTPTKLFNDVVHPSSGEWQWHTMPISSQDSQS
jgi:hypothetical protein